MAFTPETTAIPESIRNFHLTFRSVKNEDGSISKYGDFFIEVVMSDGTVRGRDGNLLPHITAQQTQQISAFLDQLRTQAEAQILP